MIKRGIFTAFVLSAALVSSSIHAAASNMPQVVNGFTIERIATIDGARELAVAPNGDLFVGTLGPDVQVVPDAESDHPGAPQNFASFDNSPAAGVSFGPDALYVGTQFAVYRIPYRAGDRHARSSPEKIGTVRPSGIARDHETTTVAYVDGTLYASVGSSCDACQPELDDTRASIQRIDLSTKQMIPEAQHIRNAVALAVDPSTHTLWAGVAGMDHLPPGQPYEIFDAITSHHAPVNYGWPRCYDNQRSDTEYSGDCSTTPIPRVIFPAYETPIGAVFYPTDQNGRYAFPSQYRGGVFVTLRGSWHGPAQGLSGFIPPRVVFVPMQGDTPAHPANWNDPSTQWIQFVGGYQEGGTDKRIGRPTGIAVGTDGSLFVADDQAGAIYRIRPKS
jgi:glucose/arabinose dehydrogenase